MIKRFFNRILAWFKPKPRHSGEIKFFDRKKRFGFIIADQHEYFFHAAAIRGGDYRHLQDGVQVTFVLSQGRKGPQADDVMIVTKVKKQRKKLA
jgi:CspA family cold shock protein